MLRHPLSLPHQQENRFREKRQLPKATSLSAAELGLTLPPRPWVPSAFGSTARQGVGLREGLVLLHPQPSLLTDGLFSFHMEGPQRIMPPKTAASTLELRHPAVHSRRSFAYHRLTDSTWPPPPRTPPHPRWQAELLVWKPCRGWESGSVDLGCWNITERRGRVWVHWRVCGYPS